MRPMGLRKFGSNEGHQNCGICHPEQKSLDKRGRQQAARDVSAGLGDLQDEEDEFWREFEEDQRRWNA